MAKEEKGAHKTSIIALIIIAIIVIGAIFVLISANYMFSSRSSERNYLYRVTNVINGDSVVVERGNYVRLIGIDAPEKNKSFYEDSKDFISSLLLNKTIAIEADLEDSDNYGRLLRYLFVKDENGREIFVNAEMIKRGYAVPILNENNDKYQKELERARLECLKLKINLCAL